MPRDRAIKVWLDGVTAARLALRAEQAGTTVSEYVGDLIARDAAQGGQADALAPEQLELHYLGVILLRAVLGRAVGEDEAGRLVERAKAKATEQAQAVLADLQPAKARV